MFLLRLRELVGIFFKHANAPLSLSFPGHAMLSQPDWARVFRSISGFLFGSITLLPLQYKLF